MLAAGVVGVTVTVRRTKRFAKTRRLAVLRSRLAAADESPRRGHPSITVGGKRLWRNRHHLDAAAMTEAQWRARWDGRVRAAITALLDLSTQQNCSAVVVENLDFADARATGRDTMGRGARGKRFRRTVAGIPTARFRCRLTSMAARRGIAVIGVDAAYTSRWGAQHWAKPLQEQTSDPVTRHHAAAAAMRMSRVSWNFGSGPVSIRLRSPDHCA
jgi:hypothetical protein